MNRLLVSLVLMHLSGVFGDTDENKSVMKGEPVTLHIKSNEIQGAEKLRWTFNGANIAEIDKEVNGKPKYDDERFRDRLKLDPQTGSLNITNIRTTDAGQYKLQISRSSGISFKSFNVTVNAATEPDQRSHWVITGPLLSAALVLLGGSFLGYKHCKNKQSKDEEKETDVPLKEETPNINSS